MTHYVRGFFLLSVATGVLSSPVAALAGATFAFPSAATFPVDGASSAVLTDINRDAKLDLVFTKGSRLRVWRGDGVGGFAPFSSLAAPDGFGAGALVATDLNNDGWPDIVATGYAHSLIVLMNNGDGSLAEARLVDYGNPAVGVAAGDVNGDGNMDVVTVGDTLPGAVLLGDGLGGLTFNATFNPSSCGTNLVLGDFNGDGKTDAAVADSNYPYGHIVFLEGNGTGRFTGAHFMVTPPFTRSIAAGDFNGDGLLDVVTAASYLDTNQVTVFRGCGCSGFASSYTLPVDPAAGDVAVGDFNGDGRADWIVSEALGIRLGFGDPTFRFPGAAYVTSPNPWNLLVGDLNGDGRSDVVAIGYSRSDYSFIVLLNDAAGGLLGGRAYSTNYASSAVVAADLDRDAKADLVVATHSLDTLSVYRAKDDGLAPPATYSVVKPRAVAVGDVNGDGWPDIAVASDGPQFGLSSVLLLLSNGGTGFQPPTTVATGFKYEVALVDFDGDGDLDLIAPGFSGVSIFLGDGAGAFGSESVYPAGSGPNALRVADLNQDGVLDVVVTNGSAVTVAYGDGAGGLLAPIAVSLPRSASGVTVSDVDLDGRPDLVLSNQSDSTVTILLNTLGGFVPSSQGPIAGRGGLTALADFDGDGDPDLVVLDSALDTVSVFKGYGNGVFAQPLELHASLYPSRLAMGDFDGDGRPDLAVTYNAGVALFRNQPVVNTSGETFAFGSSHYEVSEAAHTVTLTVQRHGPTTGRAVVDYAASNGTAEAGVDFYAYALDSLSFEPGVSSATISIPIQEDTRAEGPEVFFLQLTGVRGTGALGDPATASVTILDNDSGGKLAFASRSYRVGEAAPAAVLRVRRTGGSASEVTVAFSTVDGTASAGSDYAETTGVLTFGLGQMEQTLAVPILQDSAAEGDESFEVVLGEPGGGGSLGLVTVAAVTISEDEPTVAFSATHYTARESQGGAVVTVKRSGPTAAAATVSYAVADGSAHSPEDYVRKSGVLTFAPGVTTKAFGVPIVSDRLDEPDEAILLSLSGPSGGPSLGQPSTAILTIQDDDSGGRVAFGATAYRVPETAGSALISVRRTLGASGDVTVDYATSSGTAVAGTNYLATSGTLSFAPGVALRTLAVPILDDGVPTPELTVNLSLANATGGATLGVPGATVLTIQSAEPLVAFAAPAYRVSEAAGRAVVAVKRWGPATDQVTVQYATADGTATAPDDYAASAGTLTFGPGGRTATLAVPIVQDGLTEPDETLSLALSSPLGAGLGTNATTILTIGSGEPTVRFSAASYTVAESAPWATITVRRTPPLIQPVTVSYATSDGTAITPSDYQSTTGTLTFGYGVATRTFAVPINNDTGNEGGETIGLALLDVSPNAVMGAPSVATLTIAANDTAGKVQFAEADNSAAAAASLAAITVTRSGGIAGDVTVDYATSDGTATAGLDYLSNSGTLTFGTGQMSQTVLIRVLDDGVANGNKYLGLALGNPRGGAALGIPAASKLWIVEP